MWVTIQILNTALDTLKNIKSRFHSLSCQTTGCATNINYTHKRNVLYLSQIIPKCNMIFHFWLMKCISLKWKCSHQLLFKCRVCLKRCIKLSKFSSQEPFIYQFHDVISLINTETKRRLSNQEIQVLKHRSLLYFHLKRFFKNSCQFRK